MANFKNIAQLANNPLAGIVTTALRPSPLGIAYTGANLISKATTGKTIPQHVVTAAQNAANQPPSPTSNKGQSNPALAEQKMIRGVAVQDLEKLSSANPNLSRGDFDRTSRAKGGAVYYKSIGDMEAKGGC